MYMCKYFFPYVHSVLIEVFSAKPICTLENNKVNAENHM